MNAIDTNVLVYALEAGAAAKQGIADALLRRLPVAETIVPWQVLCELGSVVSRQVAAKKAPRAAIEAVNAVRRLFPIRFPTDGVFEVGWQLHLERSVSFWDAMLLAACADAGVTTLYTEDMQSARELLGVRIVNPFS